MQAFAPMVLNYSFAFSASNISRISTCHARLISGSLRLAAATCHAKIQVRQAHASKFRAARGRMSRVELIITAAA